MTCEAVTMAHSVEITEDKIAQLREDLLDSLDEEFELEMEDRLGEDAGRVSDNTSSRIRYFRELLRLQCELVKLQDWIATTQHRVVILFVGRDAAGKGGVIKRITESCNPRVVRVVALNKPTERERSSWYFQRYVEQLPAGGEMCLFDRSWYNRAGVEHVMGFCTDEEYHEFLYACPHFERLLIHSGLILIKYWFSVSDEEQEKRFQQRLTDPAKRWKLSPMDLKSRERWVDYSQAKDAMFAVTDINEAPWYVVNADDKKRARLNCIHHLLSQFDYREIERPTVELPARVRNPDYLRQPTPAEMIVPEVY